MTASRALAGLCVVEFLSWGVLYYSLPLGAPRIAAENAWSPVVVPAVFTASLVCAAVIGPRAGRWVDAFGPRPVMTIGSAAGGVAVATSATTSSFPVFAAAWVVVGAAQACTLYPPAFAAISQWFPARGAWPLTLVTLAGGISSAAFAPVTAGLIDGLGWQPAFLVLGLGYGVLSAAAALLLLSPRWRRPRRTGAAHAEFVRAIVRTREFVNARIALAVAGAGLYAVTLNMVPLLQEIGFGYREAAVVFGLVGSGQLLGRLAFLPLSRRGTPRLLTVAQVGLTTVALLAVAVTAAPGALVVVGAVFVGAVRGAHTLSVATAVSDRWGAESYATIFGRFNLPIAVAIAVSPLLGELVTSALGSYRSTSLAFAVLAAAALVVARHT
ncbi:MFS transporter [Blastococcus sp. SYSU D00820]